MGVLLLATGGLSACSGDEDGSDESAVRSSLETLVTALTHPPAVSPDGDELAAPWGDGHGVGRGGALPPRVAHQGGVVGQRGDQRSTLEARREHAGDAQRSPIAVATVDGDHRTAVTAGEVDEIEVESRG